MRLITRCPNCATMFKIVPDQLRLSEGWVRCGHCGEVFDGFSHLQARAMSPTPAAQPTEPPLPERDVSQAEDEHPPGWEQTVMPLEAESRWFEDSTFASDALSPEELKIVQGHRRRDGQVGRSEAPDEVGEAHEARAADDMPPRSAPATEPPSAPPTLSMQAPATSRPRRRADDDDARHAGARAEGAMSDRRAAATQPEIFSDRRGDMELDAEEEAQPASAEEVSFVRAARRRAFWRRPLVRGVLSLLSLVLLALLALQVAVHERDRLAAMEPRLLPWLEQLCEPVQCRIAPLRQIESVVIDSSAFNKAEGDVFRLVFTLRNTATWAVAMPALELTLTDTLDQPVVRRVLQPSELGAPAALSARSDWNATIALTLEGNALASRVAGYRLAVFYP